MTDTIKPGDPTTMWEGYAANDAARYITDGHSRSEGDLFASGIVSAGAAVSELRAALGSWDFRQGKVLDVGCAIGRHVLWLSDFFEGGAVGVDVSKEMIRLAKAGQAGNLPGVEFAVSEEGRLPLPDNSVDVVFSFTVLQHNPRANVIALLAEMHRVLKPGGVTCIQLPVVSDPAQTVYPSRADRTAYWNAAEFEAAWLPLGFIPVALAVNRHFGFHILRK